jgi:Mrp family chromosome partitioning ATPase
VDRDHLAKSLQSLDAVKGRVLGLVLNMIPAKSSDAYYNYRDGYAPEARSDRSPRQRSKERERTSS